MGQDGMPNGRKLVEAFNWHSQKDCNEYPDCNRNWGFLAGQYFVSASCPQLAPSSRRYYRYIIMLCMLYLYCTSNMYLILWMTPLGGILCFTHSALALYGVQKHVA